MLYRNIKTGSVIDVPSILKGDWEPIEESQRPKEDPAQNEKKVTKKRTKKSMET